MRFKMADDEDWTANHQVGIKNLPKIFCIWLILYGGLSKVVFLNLANYKLLPLP